MRGGVGFVRRFCATAFFLRIALSTDPVPPTTAPAPANHPGKNKNPPTQDPDEHYARLEREVLAALELWHLLKARRGGGGGGDEEGGDVDSGTAGGVGGGVVVGGGNYGGGAAAGVGGGANGGPADFSEFAGAAADEDDGDY